MSLGRWTALTEWPLVGAAILFLAAYSWAVLAQPDGSALGVAEALIWATWAVFLVDYLVRLTLADNRRTWFTRNLFDLLVIVLPMLRPLRLLRLVTVLSVLQRTAGTAFRGRIVIYVSAASALLVYVAALAVLDAERGADGPIQTFSDALWWAFVTVTTVGYGDYYPVTGLGRMIAAGLMLGGIALIGVVTATLASWIVEKVSADAEEREQTSDLAALTTEIAELRSAIQRRT